MSCSDARKLRKGLCSSSFFVQNIDTENELPAIEVVEKLEG
jgi:hypothetical protein